MRKALVTLAALWLAAEGAAAQEVTVAALGDSLTQGYGLPPEEGFVAQLQDWLDARDAGVQLINAGVSGDTAAGGAARVGWTLTEDVDAMIVALGGNDMLRALDPEVTRGSLEKILEAAEAAEVEVLLIGMEAPGNYGPDYKAEFDAIFPELADDYGTLYLDSFFAGLMTEGRDPAALRDFFQGDGIHPNAEGVARIIEAVGPKVVDLAEEARAADGEG